MEMKYNPQEKTYTIDNMPFRKIHAKIMAYTIGGSFLDGYILGIIEFAMLMLVPYMNMSASWQGFIGSSPLIGIFIGSLFFGKLSDSIGRQKIYTTNFIVIVIVSILQFFVNTPPPLFILRLILGVCIGAEYAVGPALITEFLPANRRGSALASLSVFWSVGYSVSAYVGYLLQDIGNESWRWILCSSAFFGLITLIMRIGMPESPRWLVLNGKVKEAEQVVAKYLGEDVRIDDMIHEAETVNEEESNSSYKHLFINGMWKKTLFCSIIEIASVFPLFGILTFTPMVLANIGVQNEDTGTMMLNVFMLIGTILAIFIVDRIPRKIYCAVTFLLAGVPLIILGIWSGISGALIVGLFCTCIFFNTIGGALVMYIYPSEVFPTAVRSSGIGFVTAASRIGSALGTFAVPMFMAASSLETVLIAMGIIQLIAVVATILWAPETRQAAVK